MAHLPSSTLQITLVAEGFCPIWRTIAANQRFPAHPPSLTTLYRRALYRGDPANGSWPVDTIFTTDYFAGNPHRRSLGKFCPICPRNIHTFKTFVRAVTPETWNTEITECGYLNFPSCVVAQPVDWLLPPTSSCGLSVFRGEAPILMHRNTSRP